MPSTPRTTTIFSGLVEVQQITLTDTNPGWPENKTDRNVTEVARVVLRADTLGKLQAKLAAHINLIEE